MQYCHQLILKGCICAPQSEKEILHYRMCMKLFKSSNIELIKECQGYFRCLLPSSNVKERCQKLISKYERKFGQYIYFVCVFT